MEETFICQTCKQKFSLPKAVLARYPGWKPKQCKKCMPPKASKPAKSATPKKPAKRSSQEACLTLQEVLQRYQGGPMTGIFTDGSSVPNPGPGGWGVVYVENGKVIKQDHGHEAHTTNNRMELMALIEGYKLAPKDRALTIYTDSQLCVNTLTKWAAGWIENGWRRKAGPIKNLALVQELYALYLSRSDIEIKWIKAHDGSLWNEYADALASAWNRLEL